MRATDPSLSFWLAWAEYGGAVTEDAGGGVAVVLLPEAAQASLDLPEELAVTADPDAAREENALLLIPGQPVLDRAAEFVLTEGDAGAAWVPWPTVAAPTAAVLAAAARDQFPVDHGRIDPAGEPAAVYFPLLRVGILVTYTVSLDLRFQEREEIWVDTRTGFEVPEGARRRLGTSAAGPRPTGSRPELPVDITPALAVAHATVADRARDRLATLATHATDDRRRQLAAADAYYADALASVERRRAAAAPERAALLDAQRAAIAVERSRRLAEIDATFTARHELRPFRAHLVYVPALQVPIDVRRGSRIYPTTLTWLLGAGTFAGIRCPHCTERELLVAGRHRLGCRACLPTASLAATAPTSGGTDKAPIPAGTPGPGPASPSPVPPASAGAARPARPDPVERRPPPPAGVPRSPSRPSSRVTPARRSPVPRGGVEAVGRRLADELWAAVRYGERWPRKGKGVAADSPLAAALRLYGTAGPARAIGLVDARSIVDLSAMTLTWPDALIVTTGNLWAGERRLAYSLRWSFDGAKPVVSEVVPAHATVEPRLVLADLDPAVAAVLTDAALDPRRPLDPVAADVWRIAVMLGLPVALRCLAAWWRVADRVAGTSHSAEALASGVVRAVGTRAGVPKASLPAMAAGEGNAAARLLNRHLQLTRDRLW